MLGKKKFEPKLMYNLTIDDLVPEDDFYRRLEDILDLRFIYQECKSLYGKTGNPSVDPVVFFKLNLFGFFENIISDRELVRKASDRISVRYYLGYDIDEKLPWHSTISRTRGIIKKETFELVFNKILEKCYQAGLVEGKHQSIDSTYVKANASLESVERKVPALSIKEFADKAYEENKEDEKEEKKDDNDPEGGIKTEETASEGSRRENKKYFSKTDPDSRISKKKGTPLGLYYSTHYCADSKNRVITDVLTTYADRRDSGVLLEVFYRAEQRLEQLGLTIEEISADRGYCSGENLRELEKQEVRAFIPTQEYKNTLGGISNKEFIYDEETDSFICPNKKRLKYFNYQKGKKLKKYIAGREDCPGCPLKEKCCPKAKRRMVAKTIYYKEYDRLADRLKRPEAKRAYVIRKTVSEGLFAEAKMYHSLKKFMTIGIDNAQKKSYMIASVQNIKRLIKKTGSKHLRTARKINLRETGTNRIIGSYANFMNLQLCLIK